MAERRKKVDECILYLGIVYFVALIRKKVERCTPVEGNSADMATFRKK